MSEAVSHSGRHARSGEGRVMHVSVVVCLDKGKMNKVATKITNCICQVQGISDRQMTIVLLQTTFQRYRKQEHILHCCSEAGLGFFIFRPKSIIELSIAMQLMIENGGFAIFLFLFIFFNNFGIRNMGFFFFYCSTFWFPTVFE